MRVPLRSGPLVLALGVVLSGCYQASDSASQSGSAAPAQDKPGAAASAGSSEYILTVEGMT